MTDEAFYAPVKKLTDDIRAQEANRKLDAWIDGKEAMAMLRITSLITLQKLRDTGAIEYSQPMTKVILYKRSVSSICAPYLTMIFHFCLVLKDIWFMLSRNTLSESVNDTIS